jgi:hypothetical protein
MSTFENSSKEVVARTVKQWLIDEGLPADDVKDLNCDYNFKTAYGSKNIHVAFHKRSKDSLIIIGKVHFEPDQQVMLRYTKTKREILFDIETLFIMKDVDFILETNTKEQEFTIEDIKLQKTIFFDGLSKDRFYSVLYQVSNCLQLLILQFLLLGRGKKS